MHSKLINLCFDRLYQKEYPVAVKVYAMRIIAYLSGSYPELIQELSELHEDLYKASSQGFRSAAKKIMRKKTT